MRALLYRIIISIVLGCGTFASAGWAQQAGPSAADVKRAADAFDRGREAFRAENYVEAAEHFEAADASAASAASLRLAIAARKAAGQLDRALTLSALALSTYPDNDEVREEAQAVIDEDESDYGTIVVNCDEPCALTMDSKLVHGPKAHSRTLYVEPGSHRIQASWPDDRADAEQVTVVADETRELDLSAPEPEPTSSQLETEESATTNWYDDEPEQEQAQEEDENKGWSPTVFWTGATLTVVSGGVTTFLGIRAINEPGQDAVRENCADETCDLYRQGVANQTAASVAGGVTAAVGVFTLITAVWLTDWSGMTNEAATSEKEDVWSFRTGPFMIRPHVSVGEGATLGATGTF